MGLMAPFNIKHCDDASWSFGRTFGRNLGWLGQQWDAVLGSHSTIAFASGITEKACASRGVCVCLNVSSPRNNLVWFLNNCGILQYKRVLRRGSEKGVSRRCLERPLQEYARAPYKLFWNLILFWLHLRLHFEFLGGFGFQDVIGHGWITLTLRRWHLRSSIVF